jgi:hypothetical protein
VGLTIQQQALLNTSGQINWNSWRNTRSWLHQSGRAVVRATSQTITGTQTQHRAVVSDRVVGDFIVSRDEIRWARSRWIQFESYGLMPDTTLRASLDGIDVETSPAVIVTDSNGDASGQFFIAAGTFLTNKNLPFVLVDDGDAVSPKTSARADYLASGVREIRQEVVERSRDIVTTTRGVSQSRTVRTIVGWRDPLAQTFLVSEANGIVLDSVDLYFRKKSNSVPVEIYIAYNENGIPTQSRVEQSTVVLKAVDVTVSEDSSARTRFTFNDPVYLEGGNEYSLVVMSNSNDYEMFIAKIGERDLITGNMISETPYAGVMLKSKNASTWTPMQEAVFKFGLRRCVYEIDQPKTVKFKINNMPIGYSSATYLYDMIDANFASRILANTEMTFEYSFDDIVYRPLQRRELVTMPSRRTMDADTNNLFVRATMITRSPDLSPAIFKDSTNILLIQNNIIDTDGGSYVTRPVELKTPSDELRVLMNAKLPAATSLDVYYRTTVFEPKYVEISSTIPTIYTLSGREATVYHRMTDNSIVEVGTTFINGVEEVVGENDKMFVSHMTNIGAFVDEGDFVANNIDRVIVTDEILVGSLEEYSDVVTYDLGDIVISGVRLYKSLVSGNLNNNPALSPIQWEVVDSMNLVSEVITDTPAEWRKMRLSEVPSSEIDTINNFIEYEYIPEVYPDENFNVFQVRVDFKTTNPVQVPLISDFRAIAVI